MNTHNHPKILNQSELLTRDEINSTNIPGLDESISVFIKNMISIENTKIDESNKQNYERIIKSLINGEKLSDIDIEKLKLLQFDKISEAYEKTLGTYVAGNVNETNKFQETFTHEKVVASLYRMLVENILDKGTIKTPYLKDGEKLLQKKGEVSIGGNNFSIYIDGNGVQGLYDDNNRVIPGSERYNYLSRFENIKLHGDKEFLRVELVGKTILLECMKDAENNIYFQEEEKLEGLQRIEGDIVQSKDGSHLMIGKFYSNYKLIDLTDDYKVLKDGFDGCNSLNSNGYNGLNSDSIKTTNNGVEYVYVNYKCGPGDIVILGKYSQVIRGVIKDLGADVIDGIEYFRIIGIGVGEYFVKINGNKENYILNHFNKSQINKMKLKSSIKKIGEKFIDFVGNK